MTSNHMNLYLHEQHLYDDFNIGMKPINTTKLLIRMTNVYMKNIDTSHDTHLRKTPYFDEN